MSRLADFLRWRWTPALALIGGATAFALLAIALVPDEIGRDAGSAEASPDAGPDASAALEDASSSGDRRKRRGSRKAGNEQPGASEPNSFAPGFVRRQQAAEADAGAPESE